MHRRREMESLEIHRRVVGRLELNAAPVLGKARGNLMRWLEGREDDALTAVYREWSDLLDHLGVKELCELLLAEDERAVRLRQSSPFAGVLPPQEVWKIKRPSNHATT